LTNIQYEVAQHTSLPQLVQLIRRRIARIFSNSSVFPYILSLLLQISGQRATILVAGYLGAIPGFRAGWGCYLARRRSVRLV